jgi:hypothetical protein
MNHIGLILINWFTLQKIKASGEPEPYSYPVSDTSEVSHIDGV